MLRQEDLATQPEMDVKREVEFANFLNSFLYLSKQQLEDLEREEKERILTFRESLTILHYLIQKGAHPLQLHHLPLNTLQILKKYSIEELDKLLTIISLTDLFSIHSTFLTAIFSHSHHLALLLKQGLSIEALQTPNPLLLKCIQHPQLAVILQFVTIHQILGTNLTPVPLNQLIMGGRQLTVNGNINRGSGSINNFSFSYTESTIFVLETKDTEKYFFNLTLFNKNQPLCNDIKFMMQQPMLNKINLIHDWFVIEEINHEEKMIKTMIYSENHEEIIYENYALEFDKTYLINNTPILTLAPFYEELFFEDFLKTLGESIENLRSRYGMTTSKLRLLCAHQQIVDNLLQHDVLFIHLALASEIRLRHIFSNYNQAYHVLSLTNGINLLGLTHVNHCQLKLFEIDRSKNIPPKNDASNNTSRCVIS